MSTSADSHPRTLLLRDSAAGLYAAVAVRGFRRFATYRAATVAGIFTNTVFGVIISFTFIALWDQRPYLGGYGQAQILMYVWIAQALIMPVGLFSGGIQQEFADRVRSGAVAVELQRPISLLAWRMSEDLGRALYHFITRGFAPMLAGGLLFDLAWPNSPWTYVLFAVSVTLAVMVGFATRYLMGLLAFWIIDITGFLSMMTIANIFFSGSMLPLSVFPDALRLLAELLPFRAMVQIPIDVFLHEDTSVALLPALGVQVLWVVGLLAAGQALTRAAVRKVVIQGG